jgi:hypothetical protein
MFDKLPLSVWIMAYYLLSSLFQGATIVDRVVNITPAEDYIYIPVTDQVHHPTNLCYPNVSTKSFDSSFS